MGPAIRRFFLRLVSFFRADRADAELSREIDSHLRMLEDRFIAQGMSASEARHAARRAFGGVQQTKEQQRGMRTFAWLSNSKLDVKLGIRMLAKYPGLSLVSVIGMGSAIAIATGYFTVLGAVLDSPLPFHEGDRMVVIRNHVFAGADVGDNAEASAQDFRQWREEVKSVQGLSAFTEMDRNLLIEHRPVEPATVAAMTASGFRLAQVSPALGRPLLDADENPNAPPVIVIGHDEWQRLFQGDRNIIGQTLRLDETAYTVVGVMPQGFAFPVRHRFWIPLQLSSAATSDSQPLHVFGRLAPGRSLSDARAELAAIGERMAKIFPQTHALIRPQVLPYTHAFIGIEGPEMELAFRAFQFGIGLLLVIVAANVAVLVYARTATRMGEIAVRTALGATRARIVAQLFLESLVLSGTATVIGLILLRVALDVGRAYHATSTDPADQWPFWIQLDFSAGVFVYAGLLAVLAALIAGALPAWQSTGKRVQSVLQQFSSNVAGMRLGRMWTLLIILQVAIAVAALSPAMHVAQESIRRGARRPAPAAVGMLRGNLAIPGDDATLALPMTTLVQRLQADPEVSAATFAESFPGREHYTTIEVKGDPQHPLTFFAGRNRVATNLFSVFDAPLLAGRAFASADEHASANTVIVDQTFADRLGGGHVVGRRIRYVTHVNGETQRGPWQEIIGVVPAFAESFSAPNSFDPPLPRVFRAATAGDRNPATLIVRTSSTTPGRFAPKLIAMAAGIDPRLRVERLEDVVGAWKHDQGAFTLLALGVMAVVVSVLLLSAAGIYAMMSFTVASRRREIGIRAALGADTRHLLMGIFTRTAIQLGIGVAAGLVTAAVLDQVTGGDMMGGQALILLPGVVGVIFIVGLVATVGPARRALRLEPSEVLRAD